jgi:hypothetical protein
MNGEDVNLKTLVIGLQSSLLGVLSAVFGLNLPAMILAGGGTFLILFDLFDQRQIDALSPTIPATDEQG